MSVVVVVVVVVREHGLVQLSSSSRVWLFIYCAHGIAWGSALVCYLKEMCDSVWCALFVLCQGGVPQSGLLYLQPLICSLVTLTSDARKNWYVILNISQFLKIILFVCYERDRDRQTDWVKESVCLGSVTSGPHLLDSWCASPSSLFMPRMKPGSDVEDNVWSPELVWMI